MKAYLSGPINNIPDHRKRFEVAVDMLGAQLYGDDLDGYSPRWSEIINPCEVEACDRGFNRIAERLGGRSHYPIVCEPESERLPSGHTWGCYLKHDLREMLRCDVIVLLPGWAESPGARLERYVAEQCGMRVELIVDLDFAEAMERAVEC